MASIEAPDNAKAAKKLAASYPWKVLFGDHHESHAASAFYPSPFEQAAVVTMDGVGEWATSSIGVGAGSELELLKELRFPHSLGLLYSRVHLLHRLQGQLRRVQGDGPGAVRRAQVRRRSSSDHLVEIRDDGSIWLNLEYFTYATA